MRETILARHGESEYSVTGKLNGDPGIACPLTASGIEQARQLGQRLAGVALDLCVTSEFERTRQTADVALEGRDVPRLVVAELNDPRYGEYEGRELEDYRSWASAHGPTDVPPSGGESRQAVVERYAHGFRRVLERPEGVILVVGHSLPIRYAVNAAEGADPAARAELIVYAEPHPLSAAELQRAVERLERWALEPRFA